MEEHIINTNSARIKKISLLVGFFFLINFIVTYFLHFTIIASTCMTVQQVQTDSRCLYIANNQVYQKDSRSNPHHGHPCGTDVTSILPSSHHQTPASYLLPNLIANICPATTLTPTPTSMTPSPTGNPGGMSFPIIVFLHSIYNAGDNVNPTSGGNKNPVHTRRNVTLKILNSSNVVAATAQGNVTYNAGTGNFTGTIPIPLLPPGQYTVIIATGSYLAKLVPGFQQLNGPRTMLLPAVYLVAGDINNDGQIDIGDYNTLIGCFGSKQNTSSCTAPPTPLTPGADLNDDGHVDGIDYNVFLRELSIQKGG